jgi:hypothetical protein
MFSGQGRSGFAYQNLNTDSAVFFLQERSQQPASQTAARCKPRMRVAEAW